MGSSDQWENKSYIKKSDLQELNLVYLTTMEVIKNNKGGSKLCAEGYVYTKKSSSSARVRWECSQKNVFFCKNCAYTDL